MPAAMGQRRRYLRTIAAQGGFALFPVHAIMGKEENRTARSGLFWDDAGRLLVSYIMS